MKAILQHNRHITTEMSKGKRIYIADNNPVYRDLLKLVLEQKGYSVRLFEDGYYLLKALRINKTAKIQHPDLIICDINMRVMGGLELFEEIHHSKQYADAIPFIFLTDCLDKEALVLSTEANQYEVFNKSELLQPLTETIHRVLPASTINQTTA